MHPSTANLQWVRERAERDRRSPGLELLYAVKEVILPPAIRTLITLSRCKADVELLRLCMDELEVADQAFVTPVEKWLEIQHRSSPSNFPPNLQKLSLTQLATIRNPERCGLEYSPSYSLFNILVIQIYQF
ncbi:unnamed protein product [Linum tenue]|nr:unnamed protein product [Linum tenue]